LGTTPVEEKKVEPKKEEPSFTEKYGVTATNASLGGAPAATSVSPVDQTAGIPTLGGGAGRRRLGGG